MAYGTALSVGVMFKNSENRYREASALKALARPQGEFADATDYEALQFFSSREDKESFHQRHQETVFQVPEYPEGTVLPVYLGIDAVQLHQNLYC